MKHFYAVPTQEDQEQFVYRLYFGSKGDAFDQVIKRAYLDFSRTAHGAGSYPQAHREAARLLRHEIESLPGNKTAHTQQGFDMWHKSTCHELCDAYSEAGFDKFSIGQAQKWINMTLKYIYVFGEKRMPGYLPLYNLCHVPIDNILLGTPEFKGLASFPDAWSRIKEYSAYMSFQTAARNRFPKLALLAVEFRAWQGDNAA